MSPPTSRDVGQQVVWLFVLAVPIACVAWTITHEEIFRELRDACGHRARCHRWLLGRKFFYLFTCAYCFSHYVTIFFLALTGYKLLLDDWRGYVLSFFALVWVANVYMAMLGRLRLDIRSERAQAETKEKESHVLDASVAAARAQLGNPAPSP